MKDFSKKSTKKIVVMGAKVNWGIRINCLIVSVIMDYR